MMSNHLKYKKKFISNHFSFIDLSDKLRQFERNRQESPVSSTFDFTRSLMHSIYRNEKCELDETKKGNAILENLRMITKTAC